MVLQININLDDVIVEGQKIARPSHISRSDWENIWRWVEPLCRGLPIGDKQIFKD